MPSDMDELESFFQGAFDNVIDYKVMNDGTDSLTTPEAVYCFYLQSVEEP